MLGSVAYGLILTLHCSFGANTTPDEGRRKVLLISLDGFRWDYLTRLPKHSNFSYFTNGVYAPNGITNTYVTKTFPNHYSIVTGLYEESHGITENQIYDEKTKTVINLLGDQKNADWLFGGEPIWSSYVKQNSGKPEPKVIMWIGSTYNISGVKLKTVVPYSKNVSMKNRMDMSVESLSSGTELVLLYYHEPDDTGHRVGPDDPAVTAVLRDLNDDFGYLTSQLEEHGLTDSVNVIIVSDHGMIKVNEIIQFPRNDELYVPLIKTDMLFEIMPKQGKTAEAVAYLNSMSNGKYKVYRKEDFPKKYHFANNRHILPIIVVAHPGVTFKLPWINVGTHGYNNSLKIMHPTFMARGPAFKMGYTIQEGSFKTIEVYNTICSILNLQPAPNNGSLPDAQALLADWVVGSALSVHGSRILVVLALAVFSCVSCV